MTITDEQKKRIEEEAMKYALKETRLHLFRSEIAQDAWILSATAERERANAEIEKIKRQYWDAGREGWGGEYAYNEFVDYEQSKQPKETSDE